MTLTEVFLVAMLIIFTVPYLVWRLARADCFAPLAVMLFATASSRAAGKGKSGGSGSRRKSL
jgi:hypothetical protein